MVDNPWEKAILRLVVGITGATGAVYGVRILQVLSEMSGIETHLITSTAGIQTIEIETGLSTEEVRSLADHSYSIDDLTAPLASGSFKHDGMIVAPCSMKTLAGLAHSYADTLLTRAADVTLKERRHLVLVVRETPLHLGHLRNMVAVTEMGATVMPPVPAFYYRPQSLQEIVDHSVGKALDLFGIEHNLFARWGTETT